MSGVHRERCHQRELAVGWAVHALEPDEEEGFARHLPRCQECADQVRATESVGEMLSRAVPQVDPPDRLREAILAAARSSVVPSQQVDRAPAAEPTTAEPTTAEPAAAEVPPPAPSRPALTRTRRVLVAAAAVGVLAFGAGWVGSSVSAPEQSATVAASETSTQQVVLRDEVTAEPVAVVLAEGERSSVVPVTLAGAPEGQTFWLWGTGDGAAVPLGAMTAGDGGVLAVPGGTDSGQFSGYAVSTEAAGRTPTTPSTLVAAGEVSV